MSDNKQAPDHESIDNYLRNKMDEDEEIEFEIDFLNDPELFEEVENTNRLIEGLRQLESEEPLNGFISLQQSELIATLMESNFCKWLAFEKCKLDSSELEDALSEYLLVANEKLSPAAEDMAVRTMTYFRDIQRVGVVS